MFSFVSRYQILYYPFAFIPAGSARLSLSGFLFACLLLSVCLYVSGSTRLSLSGFLFALSSAVCLSVCFRIRQAFSVWLSLCSVFCCLSVCMFPDPPGFLCLAFSLSVFCCLSVCLPPPPSLSLSPPSLSS